MKVYELLFLLYSLEDWDQEVSVLGRPFNCITVNHSTYTVNSIHEEVKR